MASRKLKHYFQQHRIIVTSAQPLEALFRTTEAIGRVGKWAAELNQYIVDFTHRSTIKSQVIADFIADWTPAAYDTTIRFEEPLWTILCDGAWCNSGTGITAVLIPPAGLKLRYAARLEFQTTNNPAEYEAILLGLSKLRALGIRRCIVKSDSQVVVGHVQKDYTAKERELARYLEQLEGWKDISRVSH